MTLSELIENLERLRSAHGGYVPVFCAPFSFKREAHEARASQKRCWWCKQRIAKERRVIGTSYGTVLKHEFNLNEMSREPEPSAWPIPGMGDITPSNPATSVTL